MKKIKSTRLFTASEGMIPSMLDSAITVSTVNVRCPRCSMYFDMKFREAYISDIQQDQINYVVSRFNSFMESIDEAVFEVYGEDIRAVALKEKIDKLKNDILTIKPALKIVKYEE